jgi:hypothetical protein
MELNKLPDRFQKLQEEAGTRQELAKTNNTREMGCQTSLTGEAIDSQATEVKRLTGMLEEAHVRTKELVTKCRQNFGAEVNDIAEGLGLKDALKEPKVFERLYEDANVRIRRLEKLRGKCNAEKAHLYKHDEASPRAATFGQSAVSMLKVSVLEPVNSSLLTGLQPLVTGRDAAPRQPLNNSWLLPPIAKCGSDVETDAGTLSLSSSWGTASRDSKCFSTCSLAFGEGLGGVSASPRPFGGTHRRLPPLRRR